MGDDNIDSAISSLEKKLQTLNKCKEDNSGDGGKVPRTEKAKDFKVTLGKFSSTESEEKPIPVSPKTPVARGAVAVSVSNYDVERESALKRISGNIIEKTPVKDQLESLVQKKVEIINSPDYNKVDQFDWRAATVAQSPGHEDAAFFKPEKNIKIDDTKEVSVEKPNASPRASSKEMIIIQQESVEREIPTPKPSPRKQKSMPIGEQKKEQQGQQPQTTWKLNGTVPKSPRKTQQTGMPSTSSLFTIGTFEHSTTQYSDVTKHF